MTKSWGRFASYPVVGMLSNDEVSFRLDKRFSLDRWMALYRTSGWYSDSTTDDLRIVRSHAYLVVTAWKNDMAVGTLTVLSDGRNYAMLDDIVVHPNWRRRRIASDLIRFALSKLRSIDPSVIKLIAIPGVEPLYESLGFRRTSETVLYLAEESEPSGRTR